MTDTDLNTLGPNSLEAKVAALMPQLMEDLGELVNIESISSLPEHADQVQHCAEDVARRLTDLGCPEVEILRADGQPAVFAHFPAPAGKPTVLLYAHHDVQPIGDAAAWTSPPFVATERDGRLFGRGTADDKGGLAVHLGALKAFGGQPPVGVKLFIEGEEEIGSPSMTKFLEVYGERLASDLIVICDSGNWEVGTASFTTTLRGLADCVVEVSTLDHALHSGSFGGVVPDALTTLCRLIATLHDDQGNVAIAGLGRRPAADLDYPLERLAAESGILAGVEFLGDGSVVERLWTRPAVSVIAIDATAVAQASNTLASSARAKISLRVAPGDDARAALEKLTAHLQQHAPWGAQVTVTEGDTGNPSVVPTDGPLVSAARHAFTTAFGKPPVEMGQGGSIPMVAALQTTFPDAEILITAVGDPDTRAHGIDESVDLSDLHRACLAETLLLAELAKLSATG